MYFKFYISINWNIVTILNLYFSISFWILLLMVWAQLYLCYCACKSCCLLKKFWAFVVILCRSPVCSEPLPSTGTQMGFIAGWVSSLSCGPLGGYVTRGSNTFALHLLVFVWQGAGQQSKCCWMGSRTPDLGSNSFSGIGFLGRGSSSLDPWRVDWLRQGGAMGKKREQRK